jgi:hypothetical protein
VMPEAAMGAPPPSPVPQGMPSVPPGSARPGAQTDVERLRRIGLWGPGQ